MALNGLLQPEGNIRNANRALKAILDCHHLLMNLDDEQILLNQVCNIIVDNSGYQLAWIGMKNASDLHKRVIPTAQAGYETGYLDNIQITWDEDELGSGPVGTCIRTGQIQIVHDIQSDPKFQPWRKRAMERGFLSCIAIPLKAGTTTLGAITIYASEIDAFDSSEVSLLNELASDLGFGIHNLRQREKHRDIGAALAESEERYRKLIEASPDAITIVDFNGKITYISPKILELYGYESAADAIGHSPLEWIAPAYQEKAVRNINGVFNGLSNPDNEYLLIKKDGSHFWGAINGAVLLNSVGEPVGMIATTRDISGRKKVEENLNESLRDLTVLNQIGKQAISNLSLGGVSRSILAGASEAVPNDLALLFIREGEKLNLAGVFPENPETTAKIPGIHCLGECLCGIAAQESKPVYSMDILTDLRCTWLECKALGLHSFVGLPLISKGEVVGVMGLASKDMVEFKRRATFLETLASEAAISIRNAIMYEKISEHARLLEQEVAERQRVELALQISQESLQKTNLQILQAYDETIEGWSRVLNLRDKETEGHTLRVAEISLELAHHMGIPEQELIHFKRGALLHDIGKMGIPDGILQKPGPLDTAELAVMRQHPQYAYDMLSPIAYLRPALDIPYYHHEKWDGSGYPFGLKCEQIPFSARIFAVADVYDALTSDRPYRKAWSEEQALAHIRQQSGLHFEPRIVTVFLELCASRQKKMAEITSK